MMHAIKLAEKNIHCKKLDWNIPSVMATALKHCSSRKSILNARSGPHLSRQVQSRSRRKAFQGCTWVELAVLGILDRGQ